MKTFLFSLIATCSLWSCTAFQLRSLDGTILYARSLEFGFPMESRLLIVPRGLNFVGSAPGNQQGISWKSQYGYIGMNQSIDRSLVSDGMNEKGLVVGMLYLPGYARYENFDPGRREETLGAWELGSLLLATCATLQEVKELLPKLQVAQQPLPKMNVPLPPNFSLPLHFYVGDKSGAVLIIEYVNGVRTLYDNPVTVLTNSPPFDWQLTNLSSYINLTPYNVASSQIGAYTVKNLSQGTGALGLPGDFTPSSRFVRAALFSHWAKPPKTSQEGVILAFHILNTFDVFEGAVQKMNGSQPEATDTTEWVLVHDQSHLKTYFRTYDGLKIQMIDFTHLDFSKSSLQEIEMAHRFAPEELKP